MVEPRRRKRPRIQQVDFDDNPALMDSSCDSVADPVPELADEDDEEDMEADTDVEVGVIIAGSEETQAAFANTGGSEATGSPTLSSTANAKNTQPATRAAIYSRMSLRQRPHPESARLQHVPPFTVRTFMSFRHLNFPSKMFMVLLTLTGPAAVWPGVCSTAGKERCWVHREAWPHQPRAASYRSSNVQ